MSQMGTGGFVVFADVQTALITEWTFDVASKIEDISSFDDELSAKVKFAHEYTGTGTINGWVDAAAHPTFVGTIDTVGDTGATCKLILTGGASGGANKEYNFTALLQNITLGVKRGEVQTYSATFKSISAIAVST